MDYAWTTVTSPGPFVACSVLAVTLALLALATPPLE